MKRQFVPAITAILFIGLLSGCTNETGENQSDAAIQSQSIAPQSTTSEQASPGNAAIEVQELEGDWFSQDFEDGVATIKRNGSIEALELVLGDSGSCPPVIDTVTVEGTTLAIALLGAPSDQVCTADLRPYRFRFTFPDADKIDQVTVDAPEEHGQHKVFNKEDFIELTD